MKGHLGSAVVVLGVALAGCGPGGAGKTGAGGGAGGPSGGGGNSGSPGGGGASGGPAGDGGACSFTPCGGDIVGTWHLASECGLASPLPCAPSNGVTIERVTSQATYTFAGDGSYTTGISGAFSETYVYPIACLTAVTDGGPETCADLETMARASFPGADAGLLDGNYTCTTEANQACLCTVSFTYASPMAGAGSYVVSGDQLIVTPTVDGGAPDAGAGMPVGYCVSGNTLTLDFTFSNSSSYEVLTLTR